MLKLKSQDQLQQLISQLTKAKRKKTQLQEFLAELNLKANPSDTMYLMEQQAMTEIYRRVEPRGSDYVGFGKFSAKTYAELLADVPSYADWVVKTAQESDTADPKLVRLSRWIVKARDVKDPVAPAPTRGYQIKEPEIPWEEMDKAKNKYEKMNKGSARSSHEADSVTVTQNLCQAIQDLKDEVQELKDDKQRKQRAVMPTGP